MCSWHPSRSGRSKRTAANLRPVWAVLGGPGRTPATQQDPPRKNTGPKDGSHKWERISALSLLSDRRTQKWWSSWLKGGTLILRLAYIITISFLTYGAYTRNQYSSRKHCFESIAFSKNKPFDYSCNIWLTGRPRNCQQRTGWLLATRVSGLVFAEGSSMSVLESGHLLWKHSTANCRA